MIERKSLLCTTCSTKITIRTAIGHGTYQEFAFPCPGCGVEIRFGMEIDYKNIKWKYNKITNGKWTKADFSGPLDFSVKSTILLDGESLIPLEGEHFSAFLSTYHLAKNPVKFRQHQAIRHHVSQNIWPLIEKLMIHEKNRNKKLYNKQIRELGYNPDRLTWKDRILLTLRVLENYNKFFYPEDKIKDSELIRQRINLAEVASPELVIKFIDYLNSTGKSGSLFFEIVNIRKRWAYLYPFLSPIFNVFYWPKRETFLDNFTLAQKRFEELKSFFVDCFETFCRVSLTAAAIEGIIWTKSLRIPTPTKTMNLEDFDSVPNGSKPDILRNLVTGHIFIPYIDNRLRNGIGHHSASYDVHDDRIRYSYQTKKGMQQGIISYIRFCEKAVRLYIQLELVSIYAHWARARAEGISGKVV